MPISDLDAAALVHDMQYIGFQDRAEADDIMVKNLLKSGHSVQSIGAYLAFKIDKAIVGNRATNDKETYNQYYTKANKILEKYGYHYKLQPM